MSKRNFRIGMVVFTVFLLFCAGRMMIADATEAKKNAVTLLQNADLTEKQLIGATALADLKSNTSELQDDADNSALQGTTEDDVEDLGPQSTPEDSVESSKPQSTPEDNVESSEPQSTPGDEVENPEPQDTPQSDASSSDKPKSSPSVDDGEAPAKSKSKEMRAVWIYFSELDKKATSYTKWKNYIDKTFDTCKENKMNTIILQVRPCADAMYPSKYYPWSKYAAGKAGKNPGFDPLKYAVSAAHKRGLEIQAWVNPYRITLPSTKLSSLPASSIARKWASSSKKSERRNVLKLDGAYYFNPASSQVQKLVANGVQEIVKNYDVDGIHMDDYFYPSLGTANLKKFDYSEYKTYVKDAKKDGTSPQSLVGWRRSNVNKMVKKVYSAVKQADKNCVFGISPAGNLSNLYASTKYYSDVKAWMKSTKYIDYICPQIYWSFTQKTAPYKKMVNEWTAIPRSKQVKLYIGLAGYRAGISLKEAKAVTDTGWAKSNTVLKRQVQYARSTKEVSGLCIFSYGTFTRKTASKEVKNLLKVLK